MGLFDTLPAPRDPAGAARGGAAPARAPARAPAPPPPGAPNAAAAAVPEYGRRGGGRWAPRAEADFAGGGAYPECAQRQYPLGMGKPGAARGERTLAVAVTAEGKIDYGALHKQGDNRNRVVHGDHRALVPKVDQLAPKGLERPDEEAVAATAAETAKALNQKVDAVLSSAKAKSLAPLPGEAKYVKYTPQGGVQGAAATRIIKIQDVQKDPLEPPKFRHKKVPKGPGSPPVPVMHSPPRKLTKEDQQDWSIPPCVSNWKNAKGYTIPLDKRLAADGRGLQEVQINDNFAKLSEALYIAEQKAREAVEMRGKIQKQLLHKEKEKKENELRELAQRARLQRSNLDDRRPEPVAAAGGAPPATAAADGTPPAGGAEAALDREGWQGRDRATHHGRRDEYLQEDEAREQEEDQEARRKRDELREERRRERERERRLEEKDRHGFKKSKLTRDRDRDIGERVALGQAKISNTGEAMYDQRLFNQDAGLGAGFGAEDDYNTFDKPLFAERGSNLYRPKPSTDGDAYGEPGADRGDGGVRTGKFKADVNFSGAGGARAGGAMEFERNAQEEDPFGLDGLLGDVKVGKKPLDKIGGGGSSMQAMAGGAAFGEPSSSGRKKGPNFVKGSG